MVTKIFEEIEKLKDKYTDMLVDLCSIESKSNDKEGVDKVGDYLCRVALDMGYTIKKKEFEKAGNVYSFTLNPDAKMSGVAVSAHMDTVFEKGVFGYPPVRIEGDRIYGPGVFDCKGGIVQCMLVMEAMKNCGYTDRPVKLILQSDEEVSSSLSDKGTLEFMVEEAKGCAAFLNTEGHRKPTITVGRKGITARTIVIEGRACHAGYYVGGISAVREAAYKVTELEKHSDVNSITFNCGAIRGGTVSNIVPDRCEIDVEFRYKTMEQKKQAEDIFENVVNTSYVEGTKSHYIQKSERIPMERTEENDKLAGIYNSVAEKYGFEAFELFESPGGADSAYTTHAGIPTVDSIGPQGADGHCTTEMTVLSSIPRMAKIMAAVILECPEKI